MLINSGFPHDAKVSLRFYIFALRVVSKMFDNLTTLWLQRDSRQFPRHDTPRLLSLNFMGFCYDFVSMPPRWIKMPHKTAAAHLHSCVYFHCSDACV